MPARGRVSGRCQSHRGCLAGRLCLHKALFGLLPWLQPAATQPFTLHARRVGTGRRWKPQLRGVGRTGRSCVVCPVGRGPDDAEQLNGRAMTALPPIGLPPAATPRLQCKPAQPLSGATPRKAAAPFGPAKPPRKSRGAPSVERPGAFSSAPALKQAPHCKGPPIEGAALAPVSRRGSSLWAPPDSRLRSCCESLGGATETRGGRWGEAASLRFPHSRPPEAARVLQRHRHDKQRQRGPAPRSISPEAAKRPLAGSSGPGTELRARFKGTLLNERRRYEHLEDDQKEEEQEEAAAADEGLVRKCTEWLRGVERAAAAGDRRADQLDSLPHLSTL